MYATNHNCCADEWPRTIPSWPLQDLYRRRRIARGLMEQEEEKEVADGEQSELRSGYGVCTSIETPHSRRGFHSGAYKRDGKGHSELASLPPQGSGPI